MLFNGRKIRLVNAQVEELFYFVLVRSIDFIERDKSLNQS